ncbi:unnamed protein product, partial [Pylaiella littoralis]
MAIVERLSERGFVFIGVTRSIGDRHSATCRHVSYRSSSQAMRCGLKVRLLQAEVVETLLYGCVTWNLKPAE